LTCLKDAAARRRRNGVGPAEEHDMDAATIEALHGALDDEFKAHATYRKVIEPFGPVRPFVNIVEAEHRHAEALLALLARAGVAPPRDTLLPCAIAAASLNRNPEAQRAVIRT